MFLGIKLLLISLYVTRINAGLLNLLLPIDDKHIKFRIYTQSDRKGTNIFGTNISNPHEVINSGFDSSKETYFCVHAWTEFEVSLINSCKIFKDRVLDKHDVNVIYIDWSIYTTNIFYSYLVLYMQKFADVISGQIKNMVETSGLDLNRSQMVGTSLGAELAGAIGTALDGKLYQVIGLDPGAPMFYHSYPQNRISKKSGQFVQVIHTATAFMNLGYRGQMGHADYFANDGEHQPLCLLTDFLGICSHITAPVIYIISLMIESHNVATKCDSYINFLSGACKDNDKSVVGGFHVDRNASGIYYFQGI